MRIFAIRETAIPLKSNLRNSGFDFSEMTTSVVAVITDVVCSGRPVAGFAFNSTGRYACGAQMRDRFIPRLLKAPPDSLLDERGLIDPAKALACMMQREKAGGHAERSVGIGTIETAIWDAVAKVEDKPLHRVLADRYNGGKLAGKIFCYVGGGWYLPGETHKTVQDEMRRHNGRRLHHAEDEGRRPAARRRHEAHRGGEVDPAQGLPARGRRQLPAGIRRPELHSYLLFDKSCNNLSGEQE